MSELKFSICYDKNVLDIFKNLIHQHHSIRCLLKMEDVGVLWKLDGFPGNKAGECKLVTDNMKPFFKDPVKFIITLDYIKFMDANENQKMAIIDHELCHCQIDENEETGELKFSTNKHDIEEFNCIVSRYGMWDESRKLFYESIKKEN